MVIKLGLQREALADPPQILQRLVAALFFDQRTCFSMKEWAGGVESKEAKAVATIAKARDLARRPPPAVKEARAQAK
eukprot:6123184-Pleurochrysis_carterae.AAC.1